MPIFLAVFLLAAQAPAQVTQPPPSGRVRVFLDCNDCDEDYVRKEVTFVDYVRNREDADVHVLVTTQDTGGGGEQWTLKFIGLGGRQGQDQTLLYNSPQTATDDEERAGFVAVFKLGLVRYAATSVIAGRLKVTYDAGKEAEQKAEQARVRWNYWVYRIGGGGDVNGEEQQNGRSIRGFFQANRTTDDWRVSFEGNGRYSDSEFLLDEDEEEGGGRTMFLRVSRNLQATGIVVKSLTQHWSLGLMGSAESQTFRNYVLRTRIAPGIEYNYFPYSESTRRMLTLQYTVGHDYHRYRETTIFGKDQEQLLDQRAEVGLSMRQPWGTANAEFNFTQFLTQPSKYSLGVDGFAEVRIFKGFSVNFF